jgi:sugar lactone lactonase YvrE
MTAHADATASFPARAVALCVCTLLYSYAAAATDVTAGRPWRFRTFADKLPVVDDIAVRRDGSVYATQALAEGNGRVVRLHAGRAEVIANGLEQPRGLLVKADSLLVTEQLDAGRVVEISLIGKGRRAIENLYNPEHLAKLLDGDVAVVENGVNGRLMRLLGNGTVEVITAGLNSPEGLAVGRDGTIFIGESGTGRVLSFKDGTLNVVIDDLDELGQIEVGPDEALWITEKGKLGRLLRLKDGALETVLTGLSEPRGIAITESGAILVAERGRERILLVEPRP